MDHWDKVLCYLFLGQHTDQQPENQNQMKENTFLKWLTLSAPEIQDQKKQFEDCGLRVIKVYLIKGRIWLILLSFGSTARRKTYPLMTKLVAHCPAILGVHLKGGQGWVGMRGIVGIKW